MAPPAESTSSSWRWRHRGINATRFCFERPDGTPAMVDRQAIRASRRGLYVADGADELEVAVGILLWSSGLHHRCRSVGLHEVIPYI